MSKPKNSDLIEEILEQQLKQTKFKIATPDTFRRMNSPSRPEYRERIVIENIQTDEKGMGWVRDLPDFRDYSMETAKDISPKHKAKGVTMTINEMAEKVGVLAGPSAIPASVNLIPWFSPIEDQSSIGSCTANAGAGIVEYFERRAFGTHIDLSRLFLYKTTRDLLHWTGDTGAYIRTTMQALTVFGVPPEEYWPYNIGSFDTEPSAFCYAFAQNYQAISYFRHDTPGIARPDLLANIKAWIAAGIPAMFGFTCYNSLYQSNSSGKIPYPSPGEHVIGGHAVVAAGYDDSITITNTINGEVTTGAFLIRNSWGTGWGMNGYGWLPYKYVLNRLAVDWWSLLKAEWIDTKKFKLV
jgi:C1A family cysteine protease